MDPSANLSDSRPESLNTLSYTHTEEMEPPLSHKPAYVESLVYKRHAEAVTDLPKYVPKRLPCTNQSVSKRPGIETMADLDCLGSLSPNCGLAECCFSEDHTNLQPTPSAVSCHPKKSDLSFHKYSAPSTSDSPQVTHSLPSTPSCHTVPSKTLQDLCHKELAVHYSLKQDSSTSEVHRIVSPASISMTDDQSDQFGPEAVLTPYSNNTDPSTLLSDPSSDLTESDCAVEPLFIFESDTQDNPCSQSNPALNHHISSDRPSAFPPILYSTRMHSEHILPAVVTQSHNHLFTKVDMDLDSEPCTQRIGLEPPTGSADAGKDGTPVGGAASTSHVNSQAVQSDNPIDLWMDACQYLAGEDKWAGNPDSEGIILDLWGSSAVSEEEAAAEIPNLPWPCPSEDREASGYPSVEEGDAVRRMSSGDIGGVWGPPHVERWASVDSWETALSDWAAIMASPPEEITAAFTEIGAEIDALTQALARDSEARSAMASPGKIPGQVSMREDPLDRGDTGASDFYPQTQIPTASLESQPRPDQTLESQPRPNQTVESQPRPDQTVESQPRPNQTVESQPRPDQTLESQPRPDQILESQPRPDQILESQPRPDQTLESQPRPDQILESQPRPDQTLESQLRLDHILESQPRPDQSQESQTKPDQTLESQLRPDQILESQPRPDQILESQPRPDQTLESQPRPDQILESQSRPDQILELQPRSNQTLESQPRPDQILESQPRPDQTLESQLRPDQILESQPRPDQSQESQPKPDQTLESQPRPGLCISPGGSNVLGEAVATTISPNTPTDPIVIKDLMEVRPEGSKATPGEENNHAGELKSTLDQDLVYLVDTHSSSTVPCVQLTSLGECSTDVRQTAASIPGFLGIPALLEDSGLDLCQFQGYVGLKDRDGDTSHEEDVVLLHIEEDWDEDVEKESTPPELNFEGPHGGAVYKVTEEDAVSPQDSSVEDRDSRHNASELTDSYLTAGESETVESEALESEAAGGELYHFGDATHALRNAGVPPGDAEAGQLGNADKHTSHDTALHQNVLSSEGPHSAMPAAPLPAGGSVLSVTVNGLEGDQDCVQVEVFNDNKEPSCPHTKTCVPLPALEVTGKSPPQSRSENKAESTNGTECSNSEEEIKEVLSVWVEDGLLDRGLRDLGDDSGDRFTRECTTLDITQDIDAPRRDPANPVTSIPGGRFIHSEKSCIAYITLEVVDPFSPKATKDTAPPGLQNGVRSGAGRETELTMPHRTHRSNLDFKTRPKKDKCATGPHPAAPACKRQESLAAHVPVQQPTKAQDSHTKHDPFPLGQEGKEDGTTAAAASKGAVAGDAPVAKSHSKKKKKHVTQNATVVKSETETPSAKEENGAKQKPMEGKISIFEAKFGTKIGKTKDKAAVISGKLDGVQAEVQKKHPEAKGLPVKEPQSRGAHVKLPPAPQTNQLNDDAVKRRRLSEKKFGKMVSALESKLNKAEVSVAPKREEAKASVDMTRRKAYNEVVKQKAPREEPKVVKVIQVIQAESVSGDPLSLCLWCQFCAASDHTVTWSREGSTLSELKRSGGDESRVSVTITKASHQDLGKYQCVLTSLHGSLSLDYLLTYEVLSEIVVLETPKNIPSSPVDIVGNEENVHCSRLLFKEDFLSQQYFGENQAASIVTEAVHFGEGMHRRAFRTKLQAGLVPQLEPGNTCVLKVHNSISYGTKDNDELVQKNFNLAVEECQVQNTAREYIKAYTTVAQSAEAFGEVPEIIPIYLVHRPSNEIPYATLEEELIGEFVKYSVRDGKEINLKRRDSEAGQKCCAFQHWVYDKTDGNLLVTDMQGVGMRLTDVGIATCKKGYKGFRGNCATSFIDQFKALHMCNKYCEILGLVSLQPKPKKTFSAPKPKPQPSSAIPKKKTFGPTVKGKS